MFCLSYQDMSVLLKPRNLFVLEFAFISFDSFYSQPDPADGSGDPKPHLEDSKPDSALSD